MSEAKSRLRWVDAGRGLAILLVVLLHATDWLRAAGVNTDAWSAFNSAVATFRLPLFFLLAGLFAQKWMTTSWRRLWSGKVSLFVWVFVLWSIIDTFSFMLGLRIQNQPGNYWHQLLGLPTALVLPRFELWFVWALAIFFVLARAARSIPIAVQLAAAGVLSLVTLSGDFIPNVGWEGLARYFFFFLAGLYLRSWVLATAQRLTVPFGAVLVTVWICMAICGTAFGLYRAVPGYYFATAIAGLGAGIAISRALANLRPLRYVGSHTLPIYLSHTSLILLTVTAVLPALPLLDSLSLSLFGPPALASLAVAAALCVYAGLRNMSVAKYLYDRPDFLTISEQRRAS